MLGQGRSIPGQPRETTNDQGGGRDEEGLRGAASHEKLQAAIFEGHRSGVYVRVLLRGVPAEFTTHFRPSAPVVLGGVVASESRLGVSSQARQLSSAKSIESKSVSRLLRMS